MQQPTPPAVSRTRFRFNIKTVVLGALGALALLAVGKSGWEAKTSWQAYSRAVDQREFDVGTNRLITGLFEVLMERLATNNALQAAGPADAATIGEIEKRRKVVREYFDPGLADLKQRDFPNKQVLIQDLDTALQKANDYRKRADEAIKLPRDQRNEELRKTFIPTITASVNAALKVWFSALYATASSDPQLARLATIKDLGWRMRDNSGQERSIVASAIASGNSIPAEALTNAASFRAQVAVLWTQLANLVADPATDPGILSAMKTAEIKYFKDFLAGADEMRKASAAGGKYSMNAGQWVDATTPQIGSLLDIMHAAGKASEAYTTKASNAAFRSMSIELGLLAAAVLVMLVSTAAVVFQVTRPLTALSKAMHELANGNFDVALPGLGRRNEVGDMAAAVDAFRIKATEKAKLDMEAKQAEEIRRGDERKAEMHRLADDFHKAVGNIVHTVSSASGQLETAAKTLTNTAETTQQQSATVAAASEEASANVESVAAAAEEMSSSVTEIARQVQHSSRIADEAVQQATQTDARMAELSQAASRIGDVVKLITAIADQTNLLALNATIEAARAGEAGRGFAVVAQEVKTLAAQTAKATDEIGGQIAAMQTATNDSVSAIKEITGTISQISQIAGAIAAAVEEQTATTQEIARNVQQASNGTKQVAANITDVNRGAGETGAASAQVLVSAQSLATESGHLAKEVEQFLATVRAA